MRTFATKSVGVLVGKPTFVKNIKNKEYANGNKSFP